GAVAFGFAHMLLAERPGPVSRRDLLAAAVGAGGVICCGFFVPMTVAVGLAVLLRRGWAAAFVNAVPPLAVYALWSVLGAPGLREGSGLDPSMALRFVVEG